MILEQADIFNRVVNKRDLSITPWEKERLQPASYELSLSPRFLVFEPTVEIIDPLALSDYTREINVDDNEQPYYEKGYLVLHPGDFIIGSTVESLQFPNDLVGILNGKSSLGRLGLQIHATAGFFDPGFRGTATLEMSNVSRLPIRLHPGMLVAQMAFYRLSRPTETPYGSRGLQSRYQNQNGPTASRYSRRRAAEQQLRLPGVEWDQYEVQQ